MSLAAACGDDDNDDTTTGGTGGGGRGGTGGTAGRGGTGGAAGSTAGTGGTGGSGTAGTGGTGGTGTAGTGGAGTAGTGGTGTSGTGGTGDEVPDAGPDAEVIVTDAGALLACAADLDDGEQGPTSTALTSAANQEVIITRVTFAGDDILVTFRGQPPTGFNFATPLVLCAGSEQTDCDGDNNASGVAELEGTGTVDGGTGILLPGEEITYTFANGLVGTSGTTAEAGELALVNGLDPTLLLFPDHGFVRAYVNWGNYTSPDPEAPATYGSLEARAIEGGAWSTAGDSIVVDGNTTIFATGDVTSADGFDACTVQP
ncbi:MAG TPA: hypothetical protein VNN80_11035 [Polyangiaceae bacterium]|nr:hypothetical protein [Polyangiaceae bacterium]